MRVLHFYNENEKLSGDIITLSSLHDYDKNLLFLLEAILLVNPLYYELNGSKKTGQPIFPVHLSKLGKELL